MIAACLRRASGPGLALVLGAIATDGQAHSLAQGGGAAVSWLRLGAALALCLALAFGAALAMRARLRPRPTGRTGVADLLATLGARLPIGPAAARRLTLVETVRLSHGIDICVLRLDDTDFVVAATAQGLVPLRADQTPSTS